MLIHITKGTTAAFPRLISNSQRIHNSIPLLNLHVNGTHREAVHRKRTQDPLGKTDNSDEMTLTDACRSLVGHTATHIPIRYTLLPKILWNNYDYIRAQNNKTKQEVEGRNFTAENADRTCAGDLGNGMMSHSMHRPHAQKWLCAWQICAKPEFWICYSVMPCQDLILFEQFCNGLFNFCLIINRKLPCCWSGAEVFWNPLHTIKSLLKVIKMCFYCNSMSVIYMLTLLTQKIHLHIH